MASEKTGGSRRRHAGGRVQVIILDGYVDRLKERGSLRFVRGRARAKLRDRLHWLADRFRGGAHGPIDDLLEAYDKVWQTLLTCALRDLLTPGAGRKEVTTICKRLREYHSIAEQSEHMMLGAWRRYREHMTHSLWVYFLGEFFIGNWYEDIPVRPDPDVRESLRRSFHAAWCITALCHDLGYSLDAISAFHGKAEKLFKSLALRVFVWVV